MGKCMCKVKVSPWEIKYTSEDKVFFYFVNFFTLTFFVNFFFA
jgi:hypothetical protein